VAAEGVQGMDAAAFEATAREAESKCPISNALRGSLAIDVEVEVR
jgi:organic hydroperoxide reductase OsmC/OhrA